MSLADDRVLDLLRDRFVTGACNNAADAYVGVSDGYGRGQTCIGTSNGAGARNVQLVVMAADATVLQVLPGFWHPADLARELRFTLVLHELWQDRALARGEQERRFADLQRAHVRALPEEEVERSTWQSFDRAAELVRASREVRDTTVCEASGTDVFDGRLRIMLKPVCRLVHDRMLAQPFRRLADFDMAAFVDYGQAYYDLNVWVDVGMGLDGKPRPADATPMERAAAAAIPRVATTAGGR